MLTSPMPGSSRRIGGSAKSGSAINTRTTRSSRPRARASSPSWSGPRSPRPSSSIVRSAPPSSPAVSIGRSRPASMARLAGDTDFLQDQTAYLVRFTVAPINREVNGVNQVTPSRCQWTSPRRDAEDDWVAAPNFTTVLDDQPFHYRARGADLHLADRFVETPSSVETDDMLHLEAAFVWGPFSMQGEYAELEALRVPDSSSVAVQTVRSQI